MGRPLIAKVFLIFLIISVLYACFKIFEPFFVILIVATILVSIFYTPYEQLLKLLRGRKNLAALIMCILVAILVIVPLANFIVYTAQRSVEAYETTLTLVEEKDIPEIVKERFWDKYNFLGINSETLKNTVIELAKDVNDIFMSGAGNLIKGTTNFIISFIMILFTMFFFFADGEKMLAKLMHWTPLPNKYDKAIFKKFKDVSASTMVSTFVTAIAQGLIGAIGFLIVGFPIFFASIIMAFASIIPYVGTALIWAPIGLYLLAIGNIWQGVFIIIWGAVVIGNSDNLIRAYLIKDKAEVHPLFIVFSILGGLSLFGFWGIIFGPLIISLAVTILHIYEMEYESVLEK